MRQGGDREGGDQEAHLWLVSEVFGELSVEGGFWISVLRSEGSLGETRRWGLSGLI